MNPVLRQRIPPSVRRLLTDIGPREEHRSSEWTDAEPESVTRDGIQLPSRGSGGRGEDFLAPADGGGRDGPGTSAGAGGSAVCGLCGAEPSRYTCPRCNAPYCGLACYRSPDHAACSEEFYKESVLRELKDMGQTEAEGRRKMQDILLGLRQKASRTEGGMESVLRGLEDEEEEGEGEGMKERAQVLELLSRLAELQQAGEEKAEEVEGILRRLEEIGGGEAVRLSGGDTEDDDGDDDVEAGEEPGLAERLSGLDIDALPEETLWELLDGEEKERFMGLVRAGTVGALIPLWRPWWEDHEEGEGGGRALVEMLEEEVKEGEGPVTEAGSSGVREEERRGGTCAAASRIETKSSKTQSHGTSSTALRKSKGKSRKEISNAKETSLSSVPPISVKIPKLSSLSSSPSPLVCHGLVNALFGYAFALRLFNGDVESATAEFCDAVLAASEALSSGRVFGSLREALEGGEAALLAGGYLDREDPHAAGRAAEAVAHIATGRGRREAAGYCLAALSQLRSALSRARADLPKGGGEEEEGARRRYFLAGKKCEFYQAWASDNARQMRGLAVGLWREHGKRQDERSRLEEDRRVVDEHRRKTQTRGGGVLIEELS